MSCTVLSACSQVFLCINVSIQWIASWWKVVIEEFNKVWNTSISHDEDLPRFVDGHFSSVFMAATIAKCNTLDSTEPRKTQLLPIFWMLYFMYTFYSIYSIRMTPQILCQVLKSGSVSTFYTGCLGVFMNQPLFPSYPVTCHSKVKTKPCFSKPQTVKVYNSKFLGNPKFRIESCSAFFTNGCGGKVTDLNLSCVFKHIARPFYGWALAKALMVVNMSLASFFLYA